MHKVGGYEVRAISRRIHGSIGSGVSADITATTPRLVLKIKGSGGNKTV